MLRLYKLSIFSLLFLANSVFAMLELELTQGVDNAMPVIIFPFANQELIDSDDNDLTAIIGSDLKNSGRFRLVDPYNFLPDEVDYEAWRARKVEAVVMGEVKASGRGFNVTFQLYDVYNKKKLFEKGYRGVKKEQIRKLAHQISDEIYQQLTGDRGIFSTKIAYVLVDRHKRPAKYKLQVADADGKNPKTLLISNFPLMSPMWSPDGKKIAYVSFEGHRAGIYVQNIASGKREVVTKFPGINGAPAWSPDGKKMAVVLTKTGYPKIYVLDLATKRLEQLTSGMSLDTEPNWAPDGKSLIFTSNRGGGPQIYRIYLNSQEIERVTYDGQYNARASFLPSGTAIALLHQAGDMFSIAVNDLNSKRVNLLTRSGLNESPSVAPNGKMIVYATNDGRKGLLAEVSVDGKVKLLLPAGEGQVQEPAWSPFL